jgi:hypothetical protein
MSTPKFVDSSSFLLDLLKEREKKEVRKKPFFISQGSNEDERTKEAPSSSPLGSQPQDPAATEAEALAAIQEAFDGEAVEALDRPEGERQWQERLAHQRAWLAEQARRSRSPWPERLSGLGDKTIGPYEACQDCLEAPSREITIRRRHIVGQWEELAVIPIPVGTWASYGGRPLYLPCAQAREAGEAR